MSEILPPEFRHEEFTAWAKQQGLQINGVGPASVFGQGVGIVAQRRIEVGEVLCDVPASVLLTVNTVPEDFRKMHEGITVHGLLASFLAFGGPDTSCYFYWKNSWPSMQDFEESMPILWPSFMREPLDWREHSYNTSRQREDAVFILPPAIAGRWTHHQMHEFWNVRETAPMYRQEKKLKTDWDIVSKVFPDKSLLVYTYYWLIVNTRSFYFKVSGGGDHDDHMVLCPFVDYFNHNDHGCVVSFSENGYTVTSDRAYEIGEQIFTSYGYVQFWRRYSEFGPVCKLRAMTQSPGVLNVPLKLGHSNDFLLCEYGFVLENNKFDCLPLDDFFAGNQIDGYSKKSLEEAGYLGNYFLDRDGVCFRTQVAIRRQANTYDWNKFTAGADIEEEEESKVAAARLLQNRVLLPYDAEAEQALHYLEKAGNAIPSGAKKTLINRWKQIRDVIRQASLIHGPRA